MGSQEAHHRVEHGFRQVVQRRADVTPRRPPPATRQNGGAPIQPSLFPQQPQGHPATQGCCGRPRRRRRCRQQVPRQQPAAVAHSGVGALLNKEGDEAFVYRAELRHPRAAHAVQRCAAAAVGHVRRSTVLQEKFCHAHIALIRSVVDGRVLLVVLILSIHRGAVLKQHARHPEAGVAAASRGARRLQQRQAAVASILDILAAVQQEGECTQLLVVDRLVQRMVALAGGVVVPQQRHRQQGLGPPLQGHGDVLLELDAIALLAGSQRRGQHVGQRPGLRRR
mmetsp:Transcript_18983/g.47960  ORF Transcript_18983/g.47960 Transcript_18983/m.47960 type:complete len:281 (-) Transcript_18983:397-1239(-)